MYPIYARNLDQIVRERLRQWPHNPPGLSNSAGNSWLKGRPDEGAQCFLKQPGSDKLRTLPDGLWLSFGGTVREPYADIFGIM